MLDMRAPPPLEREIKPKSKENLLYSKAWREAGQGPELQSTCSRYSLQRLSEADLIKSMVYVEKNFMLKGDYLN